MTQTTPAVAFDSQGTVTVRIDIQRRPRGTRREISNQDFDASTDPGIVSTLVREMWQAAAMEVRDAPPESVGTVLTFVVIVDEPRLKRRFEIDQEFVGAPSMGLIDLALAGVALKVCEKVGEVQDEVMATSPRLVATRPFLVGRAESKGTVTACFSIRLKPSGVRFEINQAFDAETDPAIVETLVQEMREKVATQAREESAAAVVSVVVSAADRHFQFTEKYDGASMRFINLALANIAPKVTAKILELQADLVKAAAEALVVGDSAGGWRDVGPSAG